MTLRGFSQLRLHDIELVIAVFDEGSIMAAGVALGMSQSVASRRLALVERLLGIQLFRRGGTGVSITPAGLEVVDRLREVTDLLSGIEATIARRADGSRRTINVAVSLTLAEVMLPRFVQELRVGEAPVDVRARALNSQGVVRSVTQGWADLGFIETPAVPPDLVAHQVGVDRLVLVTSMQSEWASVGRLSLQELESLPLFVREAGSGTRDTLEGALRRANMHLRDVVPLPTNSAVRAAALAGYGVAVVSQLVVKPEMEKGELAVLPTPPELVLDRPLTAIWRENSQFVDMTPHLIMVAQSCLLSLGAGPPGGMGEDP